MDMIDLLHESMDRSLQRLVDLPLADRSRRADALLCALERDLAVERRLLAHLNICIPGLSGVDPLAMLQQSEVDRLLTELKTRGELDARRWDAACAALRSQLDTAFVAVDLAMTERS
jgi:hypothetical protein